MPPPSAGGLCGPLSLLRKSDLCPSPQRHSPQWRVSSLSTLRLAGSLPARCKVAGRLRAALCGGWRALARRSKRPAVASTDPARRCGPAPATAAEDCNSGHSASMIQLRQGWSQDRSSIGGGGEAGCVRALFDLPALLVRDEEIASSSGAGRDPCWRIVAGACSAQAGGRSVIIPLVLPRRRPPSSFFTAVRGAAADPLQLSGWRHGRHDHLQTTGLFKSYKNNATPKTSFVACCSTAACRSPRK